MKSPKDKLVIQIEITNACVHTCSNCTRICGHHKKPFFMNFEDFKRAVDSLEEFTGIIGVMGGEPTLHPEFEKFVTYLNSKIPVKYRQNAGKLVYPQKDFIKAVSYAMDSHTFAYKSEVGTQKMICGAGLWSSMNQSYKKHFEIIQDSFVYQMLNDHGALVYHQPVLITRKELGINDTDFKQLRDKCWVNQMWSASVTPKGAFFCEIAAAMDMLTDGPGGWAVEPGWWKKEEKDFGSQLQWCEMCGIALNNYTFTRDAREGIDDISPFWAEQLQAVDSPKFNKGLVNIVEIKDSKITEATKAKSGIQFTDDSTSYRYLSGEDARFNQHNSVLFPRGFEGVLLCRTQDEKYITAKIVEYSRLFDRLYIISLEKTGYEKGLQDTVLEKCSFIVEDEFGKAFKKILDDANPDNFIIVLNETVSITGETLEHLKNCIINPGTLHYVNFSDKNNRKNTFFNARDGEAALLNKKAMSLRSIDWNKAASFQDIVNGWESSKIVTFHPDMIYTPKPLTNIFSRAARRIKLEGGLFSTLRYCINKR